jgi:hypothetical protein
VTVCSWYGRLVFLLAWARSQAANSLIDISRNSVAVTATRLLRRGGATVNLGKSCGMPARLGSLATRSGFFLGALAG